MVNINIKNGSKKLTNYKDTTTKKHKHNYVNKKILVFEISNQILYYEVLQCDKCNSFIGNLENNILKPYSKLTQEQLKLPKIYAKGKNFFNDFTNNNIIDINFEK